MGLDRRTFLQQGSLALLALGVTGPNLNSLGVPTPRKLALLVGINQYPQTSLKGCHRDVELQRELLIGRFGFRTEDILTLTGKAATRENIETAFREHLIKQVTGSDVVLFHFSGYGSRLELPQAQMVDTLIPSDGIVIAEGEIQRNDLSLDALRFLGRSLSTDKITLVLDTSHAPTSQTLQGNLRLRSLPDIPTAKALEQELILSQQGNNNKYIKTSFPGLILAAAQENQIAAEFNWDGFSAGLFTYSLTQYLWETTPPRTIFFALRSAAEQIAPIMGTLQQPTVMADNKKPLLPYYLNPVQSVAAQAIITSIDPNGIGTIKLCGLPATILNNYGINSCLIVPEQQEILLPIRSRQGTKAETYPVKTLTSLKVGQVLQELTRVFPINLGLIIALDDKLTRIEKVDATSALSSLHFVSKVVSLGDNSADCVLSVTSGDPSADVPKLGYGLSSPNGILIPNTGGVEGEAVKLAVDRLKPKLKTLLAAKLWSLTSNEYSSRLKLRAILELIGEKNTEIIVKETVVDGDIKYSEKDSNGERYDLIIPQLKPGNQIQLKVSNKGERPFYCLIVGLEAAGTAIALYSEELKSKPVMPGGTVNFLGDSTDYWVINSTPGLEKIQLICSQYPFSETYDILQKISNIKAEKDQIIDLNEPWKVAQKILEDLQAQETIAPEINLPSNEVYTLNVNNYASLDFVYQVC
jgi:hypothetical protein